jgi:hypothetical protein
LLIRQPAPAVSNNETIQMKRFKHVKQQRNAIAIKTTEMIVWRRTKGQNQNEFLHKPLDRGAVL